MRSVEVGGFIVALSLLGGACTSGSPSPTAPTPASAAPSTAATSVAGCEVRGQGPGTAVAGLLSHHIAVATSADGATATGFTEVRAGASVPDGVRLPDGTVGVYYVNAADHGVWLGRLSGASLTPVSVIAIDGVSRPDGVVDPDAFTVDGRIRLAYLNGFGAPGTGDRNMCIAESSDGVSFRTIALAWRLGAGASQTDPSVVRLPGGTWLMAISDGTRTRLGRSSDGLTFTEYSTVQFGGVPELTLAPDGRVRLYVCAQGITTYLSADQGESWTREGVIVPPGTLGRPIACDPSYVAGAGLFVFKVGS